VQRRTERPKPPAAVVLVVVLAYALGVLDIVAGLVLILLRYDAEVRATGNAFTITWWGAGMIIAGLFAIAVASGLTRARRDARVLATIAAGLSAFIAVVYIALDPSYPWFQLAVIAVAVLVILALWTGRSGRFFRDVRSRAHRA
jgi:ABC-type uncharacterized transport system permease subunit